MWQSPVRQTSRDNRTKAVPFGLCVSVLKSRFEVLRSLNLFVLSLTGVGVCSCTASSVFDSIFEGVCRCLLMPTPVFCGVSSVMSNPTVPSSCLPQAELLWRSDGFWISGLCVSASFQFRADQNEVRHLTSGNWEVTKIISYDENSDDLWVWQATAQTSLPCMQEEEDAPKQQPAHRLLSPHRYFLSTEGSPRRRQLYRFDFRLFVNVLSVKQRKLAKTNKVIFLKKCSFLPIAVYET